MSAEEEVDETVPRNKPNTKIKASAAENKEEQQPKEKTKSMMEAASALTHLGDEDGEGEGDETTLPLPKKRYIPEHKKPDAAFTFPEKLMQMMRLAEKEDIETFCIAWLEDGKSFVIRDPEEFTNSVVPKFFKATKFTSFTRKLYRWGFRQVNRGIGPDDPIIFGNDFFQRDNADLMAKMRSVTAAAIRKQPSFDMVDDYDSSSSRKRSFDVNDMQELSLQQELVEEQRKRMLLKQMMSQQNSTLPTVGGMLDQNPFHQSPLQHSVNQLNANPNVGLFQPNRIQQQQEFKMQGYSQRSLQNRNALLQSQYPSFRSHQQGQLQAPPNLQQSLEPYNATSTAEIVNAAIDALRFAK